MGSGDMNGPVLSDRTRGGVLDVLARAAEVLDGPFPPLGPLVRRGTARELLRDVWDRAVRYLGQVGADPRALARVLDLLGEVRACEHSLWDEDGLAPRYRGVFQALEELGDAHTTTELSCRAPRAAERIGFDRVLLSRIDEEARWVPESIFVARDERWGLDILEAGRSNVRTLDDSLLETRIVHSGEPLTVLSTARAAGLHPELVAASRTRSYVAAPLTAARTVIGFLHADLYGQDQPVRPADRDVLWLYCDGLSELLVRATVTEHLRRLHDDLDAAITDPARIGSGRPPPPALEPVPRLRGTEPPRTRAAPPPPAGTEVNGPAAALSSREVEVVRLMCRGASNAVIARTLFISEGTVKSHVKHILRKLGAANRAEAAAIWLRAQGTAGR
jgi:DNA-binding CsgD family transcriptional regulator